jgi:hypothetical protein
MTDSIELLKKLQIGAGTKLLLIDVPKTVSDLLLAGAEVEAVRPGDAYDGVLAFCDTPKAVAFAAEKALGRMPSDGLLWMAYRKGKAGQDSGLTRDAGWAALTDAGWETVRAVSIDDTWTGLRFRRSEMVGKRS